jgi:hypothetical protein
MEIETKESKIKLSSSFDNDGFGDSFFINSFHNKNGDNIFICKELAS